MKFIVEIRGPASYRADTVQSELEAELRANGWDCDIVPFNIYTVHKELQQLEETN